jgi:hypothetical protein
MVGEGETRARPVEKKKAIAQQLFLKSVMPGCVDICFGMASRRCAGEVRGKDRRRSDP